MKREQIEQSDVVTLMTWILVISLLVIKTIIS